MDFEAFRSSHITIAAVERKLLLIAEAGVRLRQDAPALCPDQPWRNIRGMGNWLRHDYDRVDLSFVSCPLSNTQMRLYHLVRQFPNRARGHAPSFIKNAKLTRHAAREWQLLLH